MGLNGLYLNIKGREKQGIVDPADAEALKIEIQQKLNGLKDPDSGAVGITGVFITGNVYRGPYTENAPDLLVGYGAGYRASWDSVLGKVTSQVFEDNLKAWSGDHCIDPRLVPGVLFSSHKFVEDKPHIVDVAPTILNLFGLPLPSHFDGKAWNLAVEKAS
jgi:predicted AlkP superfamily phosphohydrolase/phosphomutase